MAGYATPTSSAGHPSGRVSAGHELTLQPDHSMGAGHEKQGFQRRFDFGGMLGVTPAASA